MRSSSSFSNNNGRDNRFRFSGLILLNRPRFIIKLSSSFFTCCIQSLTGTPREVTMWLTISDMEVESHTFISSVGVAFKFPSWFSLELMAPTCLIFCVSRRTWKIDMCLSHLQWDSVEAPVSTHVSWFLAWHVMARLVLPVCHPKS